MREIRPSGSEGGGDRPGLSLPLSFVKRAFARDPGAQRTPT